MQLHRMVNRAQQLGCSRWKPSIPYTTQTPLTYDFLPRAGTFLALGESDASGCWVTVAYLANTRAPALTLETGLQRRAITALCLGSGLLGAAVWTCRLYGRGGPPTTPGYLHYAVDDFPSVSGTHMNTRC